MSAQQSHSPLKATEDCPDCFYKRQQFEFVFGRINCIQHRRRDDLPTMASAPFCELWNRVVDPSRHTNELWNRVVEPSRLVDSHLGLNFPQFVVCTGRVRGGPWTNCGIGPPALVDI